MIYETIILAAAKAANVPGALLLAICMHESGLSNTFVPLDGKTPTFGICQVKYPTAQMLGFKGKPEDLMRPKINARYAAKYLSYQMNRYDKDWCKITSAYNAGTYTESRKYPGYPRNIKYVRKVQAKLEIDLQHRLSCGTNMIAKE